MTLAAEPRRWDARNVCDFSPRLSPRLFEVRLELLAAFSRIRGAQHAPLLACMNINPKDRCATCPTSSPPSGGCCSPYLS